MRKGIVIGVAVALLFGATAQAALLEETWDSGQNGWTAYNGTWTPSQIQTPNAPPRSGAYAVGPTFAFGNSTSLAVRDGEVLRVGKSLGDMTGVDRVSMVWDRWDWGYNTNQSRSFGGFQNVVSGALVVDKAMMRLGTNNNANYQLHYYTTALQTVTTTVPYDPGHHSFRLDFRRSTHTIDYWIDGVHGSVTNAALTLLPNSAVLGYNYSNDVAGSMVRTNYDNIVVAPEPVTMVLLGLGCLFLRRRRA